MAIYRVLIPVGADATAMAERAKFVRDGFSWPALLFGPFWLLARRLWRALAVWCVGAILVGAAIRFGLLPAAAATWLNLLSSLFLGFEGQNLAAAAIERRGYALCDIVNGPDIDTAERGFFFRWLGDAVAPRAAAARTEGAPAAAH